MRRILTPLASLVLAGTVGAAACSSSGGGTADNTFGSGGSAASGGSSAAGGADGSAASGGSSASSGSGGSGAGFQVDSGDGDGALNKDTACAQQEAEATLVKKPVDIIFVIDNSGSMSNEISAVQQQINQSFAQIISAAGIDYKVIMIADHGPVSPNESVCIDGTLNPMSNCSAVNDSSPPTQNPPLFNHYDRGNVESHDSWCKMLDWYNQGDLHGAAPNGWKDWLRTDAFKVFVEITDDGVDCGPYDDNDNAGDGQSTAMQFDTDLLALDPAQFGTAAERNYAWYSIVGVEANTPSTAPYEPSDPIVEGRCSTAPAPGTGYQALSNMTGGLKFPVCEGMGFDVVFSKIAEGVIQGAKVACEFDIPEPMMGDVIDTDTVEVEYTPGGGGAAQKFTQVPNAAACAGADTFYIENDKVFLCPAACSVVENDDAAQIGILFGCKLDDPT